MDDPRPLPLEFANRVIRQFLDHLLGTDLIAKPKDLLKLRVLFRHLGGNWEQLQLGDIKQLLLLEKLLSKWGQSKDREREPKDGG